MPILDPRHRPASRALGLLSAMACTGGLLLGPSTAGAFLTTTPVQTIEFCLNCAGGTVNSDDGSSPTTFAASNTFGRFDTGLGTLQSVRFSWVTGIQGDLWSEGDFDVPTAGLTIDVVIALPGHLPDTTLMSFGFSQAATFANGELTASINQDVSGNRAYSSPADLSHFIGNGTFGVDMSMVLGVESENATVIGRSAWASPGGTGSQARLSVEYTYDAPTSNRTPEPGTIALGALAAVLAIAHRRRSRRTA